MLSYATLPEALTANRGSDRGITYIESGQPERRLAYGALYTRALGILGVLQRAGLQPRDELALLVNTNEQCLDAFWACLLGGIVPVPVGVGVTDQHRHRLLRIFPRLQRPYLYTDRGNLTRLGAFAATIGAEAVHADLKRKAVLLDEITDISTPGELHRAHPDDTAFIQFSSGSTSEPRGVVLSHRNLLTNIAGIIDGARMTAHDSTLSWMPLTHDMGLIGFHLTPLAMGIDMGQMSTELFIRRPLAWLQQAAALGATLLSSPNFGYRHLLRSFKPERLEGVELGTVRLIFNGAEPISADLCAEFMTALAAFGLAPSAMFPVYGLAEASLAVTFPPPGEPVRSLTVDRHGLRPGAPVQRVEATAAHALRVVRVGRPVQGCRLRIGDAQGAPLPEGHLGRVLIAGDNVTAGYYRDPAANRAAFTAEGWLDTGDMGFLIEGELVITGRSKEMLLVNGQNYYPHDLEEAAASVEGLGIGKVAACGLRGVDDPTDSVVVFVVHRGDLDAFLPVVRAVRRRVFERAGLEVSEVVPVPRIPKTTSGKIQRYQLAEAYQAGEYADVVDTLARLLATPEAGSEHAHSEIEHTLLGIWQAFAGDRPLALDDNFLEAGTSSLTLAQIYGRLEELFPGALEMTDLFDHPTIRQLAAVLERKTAEGPGA